MKKLWTFFKRIVSAIVLGLASLTDGRKVYLLAQATVLFNTLTLLKVIHLGLDWTGLVNIALGVLIWIARSVAKSPGFLAWVGTKLEERLTGEIAKPVLVISETDA